MYLWAMREITEEHLDPKEVPDVRTNQVWGAVDPAPLIKSSRFPSVLVLARHLLTFLFPPAVTRIANSLAKAKNPLIITSYLGRNHAAVEQLVKFVDLTAVPVFQSCLSTVNLPFSHPSHAGVSFGQHNKLVEEADFILILDSDVPW